MGLCIKTATLAPKLQVSNGPRLQLRICARKTARLAPELLIPMSPRHQL